MEIKISEALNGIINYAREEAMRTGSYGIGPDHLYLGIVRHEDNHAFRALEALGLPPATLRQYIDERIFTNENIPYAELEHITFSRPAQNILSITILEATRLKSAEATPQHLLLALTRSTGSYGQACCRSHGIDYGRLIAYFEESGLLTERQSQPDRAEEEAGGEDNPAPKTRESET